MNLNGARRRRRLRACNPLPARHKRTLSAMHPEVAARVKVAQVEEASRLLSDNLQRHLRIVEESEWNSGDDRSYNVIGPVVRSEFEIFKTGSQFYY